MDDLYILKELAGETSPIRYDTDPVEMGKYSLEATKGLLNMREIISPHTVKANFDYASLKY